MAFRETCLGTFQVCHNVSVLQLKIFIYSRLATSQPEVLIQALLSNGLLALPVGGVCSHIPHACWWHVASTGAMPSGVMFIVAQE